MILNLREHEKYYIWRKRHRVKLADVSKYCGCNISILSMYENGLHNISDKLLGYYDEFIDKYEKGLIK